MNLSEFRASINGWLINRDYPDATIDNWIRMAEERLNDELRIKDMIKTCSAQIFDSKVALPQGWLELDFVRLVDHCPLLYHGRDEFYSGAISGHWGQYTLIGNNIVVGGSIDQTTGLMLEVSYYASVPKFTNEETWLMELHPRLYTSAVLSMATAYGVEDDRAQIWESATTNQIITLNGKNKQAKASGSLLISRRRGFG